MKDNYGVRYYWISRAKPRNVKAQGVVKRSPVLLPVVPSELH